MKSLSHQLIRPWRRLRRRRRPLAIDLDQALDQAEIPTLPAQSRLSMSMRVTDCTTDTPHTLLWNAFTATLTGGPMGFRVVIPSDNIPDTGAPVELWVQLQVRPALDQHSPDIPLDRQSLGGWRPASADPFARLTACVQAVPCAEGECQYTDPCDAPGPRGRHRSSDPDYQLVCSPLTADDQLDELLGQAADQVTGLADDLDDAFVEERMALLEEVPAEDLTELQEVLSRDGVGLDRARAAAARILTAVESIDGVPVEQLAGVDPLYLLLASSRTARYLDGQREEMTT
jgi:hypothetical protein